MAGVRARIDHAAVAAAFAPDGLHGATAADVARHSSIAKATLYARGRFKEAIFLGCVEAEVERLMDPRSEADVRTRTLRSRQHGVAPDFPAAVQVLRRCEIVGDAEDDNAEWSAATRQRVRPANQRIAGLGPVSARVNCSPRSINTDGAHPLVVAARLRLEHRSERVSKQLSGRDRIGRPGQRERRARSHQCDRPAARAQPVNTDQREDELYGDQRGDELPEQLRGRCDRRRSRDCAARRGDHNVDLVAYGLLTVTIGLGVFETLAIQAFGSTYEYRATIGVWFRHLITVQPETHTVTDARLNFQIHANSAWPLYALWPFSRLVHAWSIPFQYLGRPYIFYRRRYTAAR